MKDSIVKEIEIVDMQVCREGMVNELIWVYCCTLCPK